MIFIVTSENRALFASDLEAMHRHRKQIFIEQLGWNIQSTGDSEIDQFDGDQAIYLLAQDEPGGALLASARLLPTQSPHLLGAVLPHTCAQGVPIGRDVWEASRFCPAPHLSRRHRIELLLQIICGIMETCLLFGVRRVTLTANSSLLPLVLKCGWRAHALGPTLPDGMDEMTAVQAAMTTEGLEAVRARLKVSSPVTRFIAPFHRIAA